MNLRRFPIETAGIVLVCCIIYSLQVAWHQSNSEGVTALGGNYATLVWRGEFWRLATALLLHFTWLHLIGNLVTILLLGCYTERRVAPWVVASTFVVGGVTGDTVSALSGSAGVAAGASSGAMSLAALTLIVVARQPRSRGSLSVLVLTLGIVGFALTPSLLRTGVRPVDFAAHVGGLIGGGLFGLWSARAHPNKLQSTVMAMVALAPVLAFGLVALLSGQSAVVLNNCESADGAFRFSVPADMTVTRHGAAVVAVRPGTVIEVYSVDAPSNTSPSNPEQAAQVCLAGKLLSRVHRSYAVKVGGCDWFVVIGQDETGLRIIGLTGREKPYICIVTTGMDNVKSGMDLFNQVLVSFATR